MSSKSSKSTTQSKSMSNVKSKDKQDKDNHKEKESKNSNSNSKDSSTINSTTPSTPNKIQSSSSNSFLYWKQKESSSGNLNTTSTSTSNNESNISQTTKPQTPTKKPSIFSLGKKSGNQVTEVLSAISPDKSSSLLEDNSKRKSTPATSTPPINITNNNSSSINYSSLPHRMKSESRKSIKIFGLELFGKSEEEEEEEKEVVETNQSLPQPTPTNTLESTPTTTTPPVEISKSNSISSKKPTSSKKINQSTSTSTSTTTLVNNNNVVPQSPSKSSLKQTSKSSLSVPSSNSMSSSRKGSTPQPITTSSSLSSSPNGSSNSSSPTYKPNIPSPKKVSPILQSNSSGSSGNVSPLSSSPNTSSLPLNNNNNNNNTSNNSNNNDNNGFDDPFKNDVMLVDDLDLSKLNSKVKSKAVERLLQLELITKILSKEIESVTGKLTNEISQRKDIEAGYKELETRLQVYEARWKRYSNNLSDNLNINNNNTNSNLENIIISTKSIQEEKEDEKIKLFKEERESQRISTLITRIDTLEKKVQSLEQNNRQLNEDIHFLQSESSLSTTDKKKKLKKLEKDKEKEREKELHKQKELEKQLQKEKEKEKEREREILREQKELEKQKQKDLKRGQTVSNINGKRDKELKDSKEPRESKNLDDLSEITDTPSINNNNNDVINNINNNNNINSGNESELSGSFEKKSKKVFFGDDLDIINNMDDSNNNSSYHHATSKSSTGGYSISSTVTLRKHAAKRLSAHISGTKGLLDDEIESLRKVVNDENITSEEKSKKVKGFFNDYYIGDYNDIINEKKTRMRSKSLSKDKEEEALEKISPNFIFSNSSGSLSGSISTHKINNDSNNNEVIVPSKNNILTSSFDPNITTKEPTTTTPSSSSPSITTTSTNSNTTTTSTSPSTTPELSSTTPTITTVTPNNRSEKKRNNTGYLTLGRMFKKDDTISILSDKFKDRKTRDELISNNIIKVSIFGTEITEDLYGLISEYFNNSFKVLLENRGLEDLFKKDVEESTVNEFIEKVESKLLNHFNDQDPHVIANALIKYLGKLPTLLLSKISTTLISSVEFQSDIYRTSIIRSALFSLQPAQKNLLISLLSFLNEVTKPKSSNIIIDECENNKPNEEEQKEEEEVEKIEQPLKEEEVNINNCCQQIDYLLNLFSKLIIDKNAINSQDKLIVSSKVLKYLILDVEGFEKQQSHPDIVYILRDNDNIVKAASLDKVIEKLFDITSNKDPDYNYTVFYTYDYYTDSRSLLEKFIHYYRLLSSNDKHSLVIASVAMFWMKIHHIKLSTDLAFIHKLKEFTESSEPIPKLHTTIFAYFKTFFQKQSSSPLTLATAVDIYSGKKNHSKEKNSKNTPHLKGDHIDLYHLGPAIIAEQITSIDSDLLLAIPPSQFLHKAFTKYETSLQFHNMVDKFNEWAKFTATEILSKEKLVDRTNSLAFFIEIAKSCVDLGNYNAASAIVGGLNHSSITRLKLTWEKLPTKVHQDYERLETLFDMSMNYKNYREELKNCGSKVIPYLGLFPKDLIAIEEGNDSKTQNGLINIEKFRLLYLMIKKIQSYQQPLFNIKVSDPIKDYLHRISNHFIEEKDYYPISLRLEPRANNPSNLSASAVI